MPEHIVKIIKYLPAVCSLLLLTFQGSSSISQTFSANIFAYLALCLAFTLGDNLCLCEISYCFYLLICKSLKGKDDVLVIFKSLYKQI